MFTSIQSSLVVTLSPTRRIKRGTTTTMAAAKAAALPIYRIVLLLCYCCCLLLGSIPAVAGTVSQQSRIDTSNQQHESSSSSFHLTAITNTVSGVEEDEQQQQLQQHVPLLHSERRRSTNQNNDSITTTLSQQREDNDKQSVVVQEDDEMTILEMEKQQINRHLQVAVPIAVPVAVPTISTPVIVKPKLFSVRINAGSNVSWTDPDTGHVWLPDSDQYSYGISVPFDDTVNTNCTKELSIQSKSSLYDPILLCSYRVFLNPTPTPGGANISGGYKIPVHHNGKYLVRLIFSERYFSQRKQRVFSVSIQNKLIRTSLDVLQAQQQQLFLGTSVLINKNVSTSSTNKRKKMSLIEVNSEEEQSITTEARSTTLATILGAEAAIGIKKPYFMSSTIVSINWPTKFIHIHFTNKVDSAMINAIEIVPQGPPPIQLPSKPIRINTGSDIDWIDPNTGFKWHADRFTTDGFTITNSNTTAKDIAETEQDSLYNTYRAFCCEGGTYKIPVAPGQYMVNLYFAETYFTEAKDRIFKLSIQDKVIEDSFDVVSKTNGKSNWAYRVQTNVIIDSWENDMIKIQFTPIVDNAFINAIEIYSSNTTIVPTAPVVVPTAPAIAVPIKVPSSLVRTAAPSTKKTTTTTKPVKVPVPKPVATSAPVPVPVPIKVVPTTGVSVRINAGSMKDWTDPVTGYTWEADKHFLEGWDFDGDVRTIAKTDQDVLYSSHRAFCCGGGGYSIPVPSGTYTVILMFADVRYEKENLRVFKLSVQGEVINPSFDIVAVAGPDSAYRVLTVVTVEDGKIDIKLESIVENPMINAIEILPGEQTFAPTPDPLLGEFEPIRINVGMREDWIDPETNFVWSADNKYTEDGIGFDICPAEIKDTSKDELFCGHRSFPGVFNSIGEYKIPVQKGLYTVNLMFAETFSKYKRDRMFNVIVQGVVVAENLDLVEVAGNFTAYTVSTIATVTPVSKINYISIQIVNVLGNGLLCAIEVLQYIPPPTPPPPPSPVIRVNCGHDASFTDSAGIEWSADTSFTDGASASKIVDDILGTTDDKLYYSYRIGDPVAYNFSLPAGVYQVTLFFAETKHTNIGDRVMDIRIGDTIVKNGYDILSVVPPLTSTNLRFFHLVDNGILNITISKSLIVTSSAPPKLNAIEVVLDALHISHAVARGPYYSTVSDTTGKATIQLNGEASHTHGQGMLITDAEWTEGDKVLGKYLNLNYSFPPGEHTIVLSIKDSGGNKDTETTTVAIREFGFPTISEILPNTGSIEGGYEVTLKGAGFTDDDANTFVDFGFTNFTGSSITIVDDFTIKIKCPKVKFAQQVPVVVKTRKGISEVALFDYVGSVPILWTSGSLFSVVSPTVLRFGSDRKLYVATTKGVILKMTFNDDFTIATNTITVEVNENKDYILGLALDPMDVKENPDVYYTSARLFHGGTLSSSGSTINGQIKRASGANLETVVTVISGIPVSDYDHGLNAIVFGDNGELYFTVGSNTNGGVPGEMSKSRTLKENFLSAAINVAYMSHPDFDGAIKWSAPDDGNMIAKGIDIYAAGLRNPFGLDFHSNGKLYGQDNSPNEGYGEYSTGCGDDEKIPPYNDMDEFSWIRQGHYYGHPNKKRADFFDDPRQCKWWSNTEKSNEGLTGALISASPCRAGLMEYRSNHFDGQLRGNIISTQYGVTPSLFRLILNEDGTNLIPQSYTYIPLNVGEAALDVTQAPNGNLIETRYTANSIGYHAPVVAATTDVLIYTVFPHRGPTSGSNLFSIYGTNFGIVTKDVKVTVGTVDCPIRTVTATRIDCTLPGGSGTVDVAVTVAGASATYEKGYKYITGVPPSGFVLPVYDGKKPTK